MTEYSRVIERMNKIVQRYLKTDNSDIHTLLDLLKQMTSILYYLETIRSDIHKDYQLAIKTYIEQGNTVARSENLANVDHPDMYMLRRTMDGAYRIVDSIRTTVSFMKAEYSNT